MLRCSCRDRMSRAFQSVHCFPRDFPSDSQNPVARLANVGDGDGLHQLRRRGAPLPGGTRETGLLQGNVLRAVWSVHFAGPRPVKSHAGRAHGRGQVQRAGVGTDEHLRPTRQARPTRPAWSSAPTGRAPASRPRSARPISISFWPAHTTSVGKFQAVAQMRGHGGEAIGGPELRRPARPRIDDGKPALQAGAAE